MLLLHLPNALGVRDVLILGSFEQTGGVTSHRLGAAVSLMGERTPCPSATNLIRSV